MVRADRAGVGAARPGPVAAAVAGADGRARQRRRRGSARRSSAVSRAGPDRGGELRLRPAASAACAAGATRAGRRGSGAGAARSRSVWACAARRVVELGAAGRRGRRSTASSSSITTWPFGVGLADERGPAADLERVVAHHVASTRAEGLGVALVELRPPGRRRRRAARRPGARLVASVLVSVWIWRSRSAAWRCAANHWFGGRVDRGAGRRDRLGRRLRGDAALGAPASASATTHASALRASEGGRARQPDDEAVLRDAVLRHTSAAPDTTFEGPGHAGVTLVKWPAPGDSGSHGVWYCSDETRELPAAAHRPRPKKFRSRRSDRPL